MANNYFLYTGGNPNKHFLLPCNGRTKRTDLVVLAMLDCLFDYQGGLNRRTIDQIAAEKKAVREHKEVVADVRQHICIVSVETIDNVTYKISGKDMQGMYSYSDLVFVPALEEDTAAGKFVSKNLHILVVEPGKPKPYEKDVSADLKTLQSLVGGLIEYDYTFLKDYGVVLVANAKGKIKGLPLNRKLISGQLQPCIAGTFFICSFDGEELKSIAEPQLTYFKTYFSGTRLMIS